MCLIQTGPSALVRKTLLETTGMIKDIFSSNGDGIGAMYASTKRGLRIVKALPRTVDEVTTFIRNLPNDDRQIALHWRMKTHGLIDLENCHPYTVVPGKVAMMHNGILHTGNKEDTTKSDTWHFIQTYLADTVAQAPQVVHSPGFIKMCAQFIEDNRFVFMDDEGQLTIINEDQGVKVNGMWFSNTYAWSPEMLIAGYKPRFRYPSGWGEDDESCGPWYSTYWKSRSGEAWSAQGHVWSEARIKAFVEAVNDCDVDTVRTTVEAIPFSACEALFKRMSCRPTAAVATVEGRAKLAPLDLAALDAFLEVKSGDPIFDKTVYKMARDNPSKFAETACYLLDWAYLLGPGETKDETPKIELRKDPYDVDGGDKTYTYEGYTINVFYDDRDSAWSYFTNAEDGANVANGYGYDNRAEALSWACEEIDEIVEEAAEDDKKEAQKELDLELDAALERDGPDYSAANDDDVREAVETLVNNVQH